jgi:polyhydroxyalkanoate synthase
MHIEFLRGLYLNNDLAEGRFRVKGHQLVLGDISLPMFLVGTETDHVAPWHSVFKMHALNEEEMTFVLTSGGHNAGIVSEPGHLRRHYRIRTRPEGGPSLGPDEWERDTPPKDGSWWPEWAAWLKQHSSGGLIGPPQVGSSKFRPLCDAPGTYVLEK